MVYCLDTKGSHLLSDAVARKLFDIQDGWKNLKMSLLFVSQLRARPTWWALHGYTVWKMKSGTPTPVHVDDLDKAVKECLK